MTLFSLSSQCKVDVWGWYHTRQWEVAKETSHTHSADAPQLSPLSPLDPISLQPGKSASAKMWACSCQRRSSLTHTYPLPCALLWPVDVPLSDEAQVCGECHYSLCHGQELGEITSWSLKEYLFNLASFKTEASPWEMVLPPSTLSRLCFCLQGTAHKSTYVRTQHGPVFCLNMI